MKEHLDKLVGNLREELIQYGELLSLLEQQQEMIVNRSADGIMQNLTSIHAQMAEIAKARISREQCREDAAGSLGLDGELPIKEMYSSFPVEYQSLVQALVDEVNELLIKANQRLRQNHLLLSRSLEFMQKLIQSLFPTQAGQTYDQSGQVGTAYVPQRTTYETLI
jgi:flagellar biosynthesis/type III secretory pathway chaperone|tara:strand:- start:653 stop:1150 length:498 start_codon:yes stop_codon:yes gene_type:complete